MSLTRGLRLLVCLLLSANGSVWGQDPAKLSFTGGGSMPPWAVPVLKLVSATHVEPTTGVVISGGLVVVPGEFVSGGDEIIVLDGGTDIIRNGRPARIERRFPVENLVVLAVRNLSKPGAGLSAGRLEDGAELTLAAFPPAELIEQGAAPLSVPAKLTVLRDSGKASISSETPLPNVTGALLDRCGNLAGLSAADGVQSMSTAEAPRYRFKASLLRILRELRLDPVESVCVEAAAEPAVEEEPAEPDPQEEAAEDGSVGEPEPSEDPIAEQDDPAVEEQPADQPPPPGIDVLPPYETDRAEVPAPAEDDGGPVVSPWLALLAAAVFFTLAVIVRQLRGRHEENTGAEKQDTRLAPRPATAAGEPAGAGEEPRPGLDSRLVIRGEYPDGTTFETSCGVSARAINVVIGRGNADLGIDSPAVSRRHARLNGSRGMLTISDLGSNNGTSINGVPCLEGEIMYISPQDRIILGDVLVRVAVVPDDATSEQAAK